MSYGMTSGALSRGRSTRNRVMLAMATAVALLALTICASSASAAFVANGHSIAVSSTQAGSHPAVTLSASNDALQADKNNDDLRTLDFELPAGLNLNPKAVPTPCPTATFNSGACTSQTKVGSLSVTYRVGLSNYTVAGTVYSITPDADSLINFGFVINASSRIQKFLVKSGKTLGLTKAPLTISIPEIPYKVKSNIGLSTDITISNFSVTLDGRSGFTSYPVPAFTTAPTRCDAATSTAKFLSYLDVTATRTASYTPTGCNLIKSDPSFQIAATNTKAGQATGINSTVYVPDADKDQAIQNSHIKGIAVDLEKGTTLNLTTLNATGLCSETQLASDTCPAASKIGTASLAVTHLVGSMTGEIYLTSRDLIKFAYVLRGTSGTKTILRGSLDIVSQSYSGGSLRLNFQGLPQVPWSSANLNLTSKLVNNPKNSCPNATAWAEISGYAGNVMLHGAYYKQSACPVDTTITTATPSLIRNRMPIINFTATPADGATFECQVDYAGYTPCVSPFMTSRLADGDHTFGVRAVRDGATDTSPAQWAFTLDSTPPVVGITAPATNGQVINGSDVQVNFVAEAGATTTCRVDATPFEACSSPKTFTGLTDGAHTVTVTARDTAGNAGTSTRSFTVALAKPPIVTISSPAPGSKTLLNSVKPTFAYSSPAGVPITSVICTVYFIYYTTSDGEDYDYENSDPVPCKSGDEFSLGEEDRFRFHVEVTDANGDVGSADVKFTSGIRPPSGPHVAEADHIGSGRITHRDPGFQLEKGPVTWPNTVYECSLELVGSEPVWLPCGSPTDLPRFKKATPLTDGEWDLRLRARSGDIVGYSSGFDFTVGPWSAKYEMTPSTTAAGAHPNLDVKITPDKAGQLRTVDMTLPKGLIGALTAFPQCPAANVATADCAIETEIGDVEVDYQIAGLTGLRPTDGSVFFTGPQVPGDTAGMVVKVNAPVDPFADVIIPLRIQLINNAQQMRIFTDAIPTVVGDIDDPTHFTNFWVNEFIMHVRGGQGSPFPLLTNPSSCLASQFSAVFGDPVGNKTPSAAIPFQATGCAAVPFAPTYSQTISSTTAGALAGLTADIAVPAGNSTLRRAKVVQPASLKVNTPALGTDADQCGSSTVKPDGTFDPTGCPSAAKVGTVSISSPLLPRAVVGTVHLISASPLPSFGVYVNDAAFGLKLGFVGTNSTPVDENCDPDVTGFCDALITTQFQTLPDVPSSTIRLVINGPSRVTTTGTTLDGQLLKVANPADRICYPTSSGLATITPHSATPAVTRAIPLTITGCPAR